MTFFWIGLGVVVALIQSLSNKYKITNQRVVWTRGLIAQKDEEIEYVRVKDTNFKQGILQRIFGVGTVRVLSSDSSAPTFILQLSNPREWRERLRDLIRQERLRSGVTYREDI